MKTKISNADFKILLKLRELQEMSPCKNVMIIVRRRVIKTHAPSINGLIMNGNIITIYLARHNIISITGQENAYGNIFAPFMISIEQE